MSDPFLGTVCSLCEKPATEGRVAGRPRCDDHSGLELGMPRDQEKRVVFKGPSAGEVGDQLKDMVDDILRYARAEGQSEVLSQLVREAEGLMDEAFRARALGQESVGKQKAEMATYLLSLISSLPAKLGAK